MLLRLPSGLKIAIPPIFPWESRNPALLRIHSGKAFHPDHVTTRLCLGLLDRVLQRHPCRSFLDVGCGSGILALTAARIGIPFVLGLDIDTRAVKLSRENALSNGLDGRSAWLTGSTSALRGCFDCVAANLPYPVVMEVCDELTERLTPTGILILSGFHDIHWRALDARLKSRGLEVLELVSGDRSFYGVPPSGSFTWMAALAAADRSRC